MLIFISVFKNRSLSIMGGETRLIQGQRRRKGRLTCHVISIVIGLRIEMV